MERNVKFDLMKGGGIILMVIGHCALPHAVSRVIFAFHMPLFFIISGYLYKERPIMDIIRRNTKKVLVPYIVTGGIVWCILSITKEDYDWGISILMANGSLPVLHYKDYAVGPLWFLMCYFVSAIFFFFLLRMKSEVWRIVVLGGGFLLAMGWRHYFNLLPFDILNAIPSIGFMYLGYKINNPSVCEVLFRNKVSLVIGYSIAILCCLCGEVSMASMIYRFLFLQFIGALYCCFIIYKICPDTQLSFGAKCFSFIGRNSLALVCIHSVDYLTGITESIMRGLMKNGEFTLMLETVLKILFVVAGYIVIRQIPLLRSIYGISVSLKKAFNK